MWHLSEKSFMCCRDVKYPIDPQWFRVLSVGWCPRLDDQGILNMRSGDVLTGHTWCPPCHISSDHCTGRSRKLDVKYPIDPQWFRGTSTTFTNSQNLFEFLIQNLSYR
ncbi:hypothetical protein PROFUN_14409 [Planoprotostelium fungivorum]|uniref:Uncharacterized protein n=1 Tax=Planoprotostelium fungivorum TaxID=1890364 RepID=A0A2P6MX84_9EUKA|nr:hypothetical protein PROFUN_14409 [Planoprotostelium fungivorum]